MTSQTDRLNTALAGRYRIERHLGEGGMAAVYLATDLRHNRSVALKLLKPELAAVLGAERFVQEIKTTAALQHPHILPLFDSGTADGFLFYVMPYIQGETVREKLNRETQFGVDQAVRITRDVADALDYAHRHGVIHRDIKPENILLHDGRPMVADFGIALAVSAAAGGRITETGLSLGTPHYMSPEQATAQKDITARSDIYSMGSVLYEMLTGNPPHTGASAQQIIMKIIVEPVEPVEKYRKSVPPNVAAAVMMALERVPADRFESAKAFADALGNPAFTTASATGARAHAAAQPRRLTIASTAAAVVALAMLAGGYAVGRLTASAPTAVPVHFTVELPDSITEVYRAGERSQAISPDGSTLVFVGMRESHGALYRRSVSRLAAEMIPGTEEGGNPFFSPDGRWLAFEAAGQLRKMHVSGGPVTPIATTGAIIGASWGDGDVIVYSHDRRLFQVSAAGGIPTAVTPFDSSTGYYAPFVLPGAKWALVGSRKAPSSYSMARVAVVELSSGRVDTIRFGTYAQYANGSLVFGGADNTLLVQPFDLSRRKTSGPATVILNDLAMRALPGSEFSVSNGWLAYEVGTPSTNKTLRVSGPEGRSFIALPGHSGDDLGDPAISPDGRRIALRLIPAGARQVVGQVQGDLWILDRHLGTLTRFTTGGGASPVWTPDGLRIAYYSPGDSMVEAGIYARNVDQTGSPQLLLAGKQYPASWLPDGRSLTFILTGGPRGPDWDSGIIAVGDSVPRWIARTAFNEGYPVVSRDGRRVAFNSDRTKQLEVYVQPIAGESAPVQVSLDGGSRPRWSPDGRTLYYVLGKSIIAATLAPGAAIAVTSRRVVTDMGVADLRGPNVNWDIFPDGKQFLWIELGAGGGPRLALVQNWIEMARAMGVKR